MHWPRVTFVESELEGGGDSVRPANCSEIVQTMTQANRKRKKAALDLISGLMMIFTNQKRSVVGDPAANLMKHKKRASHGRNCIESGGKMNGLEKYQYHGGH